MALNLGTFKTEPDSGGGLSRRSGVRDWNGNGNGHRFFIIAGKRVAGVRARLVGRPPHSAR